MPKEAIFYHKPQSEELGDAVEISQAEYFLFLDRLIENPPSAELAAWAEATRLKVIEQEGLYVQKFYFSPTRGFQYKVLIKNKLGFKNG